MEEINPENIIGGRTRGKIIDWNEAEQKAKEAGDDLDEDEDDEDDEDFEDPDDDMKDWKAYIKLVLDSWIYVRIRLHNLQEERLYWDWLSERLRISVSNTVYLKKAPDSLDPEGLHVGILPIWWHSGVRRWSIGFDLYCIRGTQKHISYIELDRFTCGYYARSFQGCIQEID